jgi:acetyltransferase-like isoleucine patch superfamily enzyme
MYGTNSIGKECLIYEPFIIGFPSREHVREEMYRGATIGDYALLRSGGIIYCDVTIGHYFQCGHNVLIREYTTIGDHCSIGTASVIERECNMGKNVNIQSMVFIPNRTTIGDGVFIGPATVLTNDRYPPSDDIQGPVLSDHAVIGAHATILPGVVIGRGAGVAAGAVVTRDVPDGMMAIGVPAKIRNLPAAMKRDLP